MTTATITSMPADRRAVIAAAVASGVSSGARVESQSDYQAVLVYGKRVNHILHLLLTIVTAGLWLLVWIPLAILGGEKRELVQVDDYGNLTKRKV